MLFNSIHFLIFFPIAVLVYFIVPHKFRYIWLLACSYYFYMSWNPVYIILIVISTLITYACGIAMEHTDHKKLCVALSLLLNLGILGYFKYCNFFLQNIAAVLSKAHIQLSLPSVDVLLPVGISFYTFQALGYTIDVYRGAEAEHNLLKYALFVSFFPQLVAGPIERSGTLLRQISEKHAFDFERMRDGLMLMLWGLFMKMVIADRIAIFVDAVYADPYNHPGFYLIVASVLFAFQIYCDFSGYSTIALGAAEVMGFRLTNNFDCPYLSRSVAEFWRRWHITLNTWFKDYLYIPLGGSRKGKIRKYINVMIVFLVSGIWHGANWGYVVWGGLNGLYQLAGQFLQPARDKLVRLLHLNRESLGHKLFKTATTFALVDISWVFFRARWFRNGLGILKSMLLARNIWIFFDDSLFSLGLDWKDFLVMLASIGILLAADILKYKGVAVRKVIAGQDLWFRWTILLAGILSLVVFGIWGSGYDAASFIYFQF